MIEFFKQHKSLIIVGIIVTVVSTVISYYIISFINNIPLSSIDIYFLFLSEIMGPAAIISVPGIIIIALIWIITFIWKRNNQLSKTIAGYENESSQGIYQKSEVEPFELDEIQYTILLSISEFGYNATVPNLVTALELMKTEVEHNIDILKDYGLIHLVGQSNSGKYYRATPIGRKYLVENH